MGHIYIPSQHIHLVKVHPEIQKSSQSASYVWSSILMAANSAILSPSISSPSMFTNWFCLPPWSWWRVTRAHSWSGEACARGTHPNREVQVLPAFWPPAQPPPPPPILLLFPPDHKSEAQAGYLCASDPRNQKQNISPCWPKIIKAFSSNVHLIYLTERWLATTNCIFNNNAHCSIFTNYTCAYIYI